MDIYVFDKHFNLVGIIDRYVSLIWRREYHKVGSFELHTYVDGYIHLLKKGNILVKENNIHEAVEIDTVNLMEENNEKVIVKGFSISRFLEDRFVWGTFQASGPVEDVMKYFVDQNAVNPPIEKRKIPYLEIGPNLGIRKTANEVNSWSTLSTLMEELAIKYDVGWRIKFDHSAKKYIFETYEGIDSSSLQDVNPMIIFSDDYENVYSQTYVDSDQNFKTMVLVGGQGEGASRKLVPINDDKSGFERKELFVDARDISDKDPDGNPLDPSEYDGRLTERGNTKLAEHQPIQTFEAGISAKSNYVYMVDFDLGDIVTIENRKWSAVLNARIITIEEVYENNTFDVRVDFGSHIPTLSDKLNSKDPLPIFTGSSGGAEYDDSEIRNEISGVDEKVDIVDEKVETVLSDVTTVTDKVTNMESQISNINSKVSTNTSKISTLETKVSTNTSKVSTLETKVSTNTTNISNNTTKITSLQNTVNTLSTDVTSINSKTTALTNSVNSLTTKISTVESSVNTVASNLATLNSNFSSLSLNVVTLSERNSVPIPDTRSTSSRPQDFPGYCTSWDFKSVGVVGSPTHSASSAYSHIQTIAGWSTSEPSGGWPIQVSYGPNGISIRQATSATAWGAWKDIPVPTLEAWRTPTMVNGWVNYATGYGTVQYYKDPYGIVHLKGLAYDGVITTANQGVIFTLPAGFRPKEYECFIAATNSSSCRVDVTTDGQVRCTDINAIWVSLSGITFRAEK